MKQREPHRACLRCYGHAISLEDLQPVIVSPRGIVHKAGQIPGRTECGIQIPPTWRQ